MMHYIISHNGCLYIVSRDSLKVNKKVKVNLNDVVTFQDGSKVKEGKVTFVGESQTAAADELVQIGNRRRRSAATSLGGSGADEQTPAGSCTGRATRSSTRSNTSSTTLTNDFKKSIKKTPQLKRVIKKRKNEADRYMEELHQDNGCNLDSESEDNLSISTSGTLRTSESSKSDGSEDDYGSRKKVLKSSKHVSEAVANNPINSIESSLTLKHFQPPQQKNKENANMGGTKSPPKKPWDPNLGSIFNEDKPNSSRKRSNEIFPGDNYLYSIETPGVVKLHDDYDVYVQKSELNRALQSKNATTFIRCMADKIYKEDVVLNATPQGFMARGKGRDFYANSKPLYRMHPDGIEALIQRAIDEEKTKKRWRSRTPPQNLRAAFSVIVSCIKKDNEKDSSSLFDDVE